MSQQRAYNIRCPKCANAQQVELYESVNVQTDPELRTALMENQLNAVTCDACGFSFRVDKPLLYNDPDRRSLVHLIPAPDTAMGMEEERFTQCLKELNGALPDGIDEPEVHLVFNRVELVERIFLLEAGLNPRIIEYIKYLIYSRNLGQVDPTEKALLFNAEDSTEEHLCFVIQDVQSQKLEGLIQYSREAYAGLCETFDEDEQTPSLMELFPGPHLSARALFIRDSQAQPGKSRK